MAGRVVVVGVGNPYRRDDAVGPAVVGALGERRVPAELVTSLGETTELIEAWHGAALAVLVDAVLTDPPDPGRVHRFTLDRPPPGQPTTSTHGIGLGEAVELARALGRLPERLVLYAVAVADVGHGTGMSAPVARVVPGLAEEIAGEIERHTGR